MGSLISWTMKSKMDGVGGGGGGRGGGWAPHRLEQRPISYCLWHHYLRSRYNLTNLQS